MADRGYVPPPDDVPDDSEVPFDDEDLIRRLKEGPRGQVIRVDPDQLHRLLDRMEAEESDDE